MKMREVDQALAAANPIEWAELPPSEGEREYLEGVVSAPQEPTGRAPGRRGTSSPRGAWARYLGGGAVICAGAVALLLLPHSAAGPAPQAPTPVYAAELARIAETTSPAIVIRDGKRGSRAVVVERRQRRLMRALEGQQAQFAQARDRNRSFVRLLKRHQRLVSVPRRNRTVVYAVKPLGRGDRLESAGTVVWNCTELPCKRSTVIAAWKLFRRLQRPGN